MKQAISIFLEKNNEIEKVRKEHVPNYEKFEPHITLVYPFEVKNQSKLKEHISNSLKDFESFYISLKGIQKSAKGYCLYLLVDEGKEKVMKLHEKLNEGILSNFRNLDMPEYIPHLTIGVFDSEEKRDNAFKKISEMNISFKMRINSIQLLTINDDFSLEFKKDFCF